MYREVIPKDNVVVKDVADTLGVGSGNVGTLCKSANINMFSRYKPVRLSANFPHKPTLPAGGVNPEYNAAWWQSQIGGCGINIPTLASVFDIGSTVWTHLKPRGGAYSEPYRIVDFGGYYHGARPPIWSGMTEHLTINKLFQSVYTFAFPLGTSGDDRTLGINDIGDLGEYYYAVAVMDSRPASTIITAASKIKDGGSSLTVDFGKLPAFTSGVKLGFFLYSARHLQTDGSLPAGTMKSIYNDPRYLNPVNVTFNNRVLISGRITHAADKLMSIYSPVSAFQGSGALRTNGGAAFKVSFSSTTGVASEVLTSQLVIDAIGYFGSSDNIGVTNAVSDANRNPVTKITVPASGEVVYHIALVSLFNIPDGGQAQVPPQTTVRAYVTLKQRATDGTKYDMAAVGLNISSM